MYTLEILPRYRRQCQTERAERQNRYRILLCTGTGCLSSGAAAVKAAFEEQIRFLPPGYSAEVRETGCHGFCEMGPLVLIEPDDVLYVRVKPEDVPEIVVRHLQNQEIVERLLYRASPDEAPTARYHDIGFYRHQRRRVLEHCGHIAPEDIGEYIAVGGYEGLELVLNAQQPESVIENITAAGLRGRGGGGFPTGRKWAFARAAAGDTKYIICNADEGDPGAFMDRSVLEGDPHRVLEGMLIGGYAIGASAGYIYVRAEYPLAVKRLTIAIRQARERGLLGANVLGTAFSFDIHIKEGAGAFVCGEETALIASIEGNRGMPRPRPPFPAVAGLWGKPTVINNVETFANIPQIIVHGPAWYAALGTERSKGTKIFALTGRIAHTGLAEVPMGMPLREIIFGIGGGILGGKQFKAVQIGGPSGGCLPESLLDLPVEYDSLLAAGAMIGSGGLVVMDESTCMVDVARFFLQFTQAESCGKCTPCREGTKRMLEILTAITEGKAPDNALELLEELATGIKETALCGLGQTAPNPILSTLRYFREEYEIHLREQRCPAGTCRSLQRYRINSACRGCTLCRKSCPVEAISGEAKQQHQIDSQRCIRCGACQKACPFQAIVRQ